MLAATAPSPLWYTTRGAGVVSLVLLTASAVLGILTTVRWRSPLMPRVLTVGLHRSISLLVLLFLALHILTAVLDPFAHLGLRDAVVPFGSSYRPLWLGLGVAAAELMLALVLTSLLRHRIGYGLWRALHWLAYACLPVAVLHGLGTGSDTRSWAGGGITALCSAALLVAIAWRLAAGWPRRSGLRLTGGAVAAAAAVALLAWAATGPLRPGWARAAGTPPELLAGGGAAPAGTPATPTPSPSPAARGLDDPVQGLAAQQDDSVRLEMRDLVDPTISLVATIPQEGDGALSLARSGRVLCSVPARITDRIDAVCAGVQVTLTLDEGGRDGVRGHVVTSGPLP